MMVVALIYTIRDFYKGIYVLIWVIWERRLVVYRKTP